MLSQNRQIQLHRDDFTAAQIHVRTALFVQNSTPKKALAERIRADLEVPDSRWSIDQPGNNMSTVGCQLNAVNSKLVGGHQVRKISGVSVNMQFVGCRQPRPGLRSSSRTSTLEPTMFPERNSWTTMRSHIPVQSPGTNFFETSFLNRILAVLNQL